MAAKISVNEWLLRFLQVHGNQYDYSKCIVESSDIKCEIICYKHGAFYQTPYKHAFRKQGCPVCGRERLKRRLTQEQALAKCRRIWGATYLYNNFIYITASKKSSVTCKKHGDWLVSFANHANNKKPRGCPSCRVSTGNNKIARVLDTYQINYVKEYTFEDCTGKIYRGRKYKLPFDFYLPDYKCCIEFDGIYHFTARQRQAIKWKTANYVDKSYTNLHRNDLLKNKYCRTNDIKLIRIPYFKFNEIKDILVEKLILSTT